MSNNKLLPTIVAEGYCCLYGFLAIEAVRGQTPNTLSAYWGFEPANFRHHYKCLKDGKRSHRCEVERGMKNPLCMRGDVATLKAEKPR